MFDFFVYLITILLFLLFAFIASYQILVLPNRNNNIHNLIHDKKYKEAEFLIKNVLKTNPHNLEMQFLLGDVYWLSDQKNLAIPILEKSLGTNTLIKSPLYQISAYRLALFYKEQHQWDKACNIMTDLISKSESNIDYEITIAEIFLQKQENQKALEHFIIAKEMAPQDVSIYKHIGKLLFQLGNFTEAFENFVEAQRIDPKDVEILFFLAEISEIMQNTDHAIELYEKITQSAKNIFGFNAAFRLHSIYEGQKNRSASILALEKAERFLKYIGPDTVDVEKEKELHYQLAEYYVESNNIDLAIEEWQKISIKDENYKDIKEKIIQYSSKQLNDLFKDMLTNQDEALYKILFDFIKSLEYTIDDYQAFGPDVIDITAHNLSDHLQNLTHHKTLFSFWCSHDKLPLDVVRRFNVYLNDPNMEIIVISTGPILSEQQQELKQKHIKFFDKNTIEEFINDRKDKLSTAKKV